MNKTKHQARTRWLLFILKLAVRLAWILYSGDVQ